MCLPVYMFVYFLWFLLVEFYVSILFFLARMGLTNKLARRYALVHIRLYVVFRLRCFNGSCFINFIYSRASMYLLVCRLKQFHLVGLIGWLELMQLDSIIEINTDDVLLILCFRQEKIFRSYEYKYFSCRSSACRCYPCLANSPIYFSFVGKVEIILGKTHPKVPSTCNKIMFAYMILGYIPFTFFCFEATFKFSYIWAPFVVQICCIFLFK